MPFFKEQAIFSQNGFVSKIGVLISYYIEVVMIPIYVGILF
jgi:hypothetical protein